MIPLLLALSCLPLDGPKLLARHFVAASTEFAQLPPEVVLGYSPVPGVVRTVRPDELQRIATKHGLSLSNPSPVCFEWRMGSLDPARAEGAMRKSIPEEARLEVLEISRGAVPEGEIEFPLSMLKGGFWRGYVQYGASRRFDVWARVRVSLTQSRVVAAVALKAGERIAPEQLRVEQVDSSPEPGYVTRIDEAAGMVSKRSVAAGAPLIARMLDSAATVQKGDTVRLRSVAGAAQVTIEVNAQGAGKVGDFIPVKNPASGRVLRARVEKAGEVTVVQ